MKKIGIITYHHYYNYGTMLQAWALEKAINKVGYCAEIIDFKQDNSLSKIGMLKLRIQRADYYIKNIKKILYFLKTKPDFERRNRLFEKFYQYYIKVGKTTYKTIEELNNNPPIYDAYVVGSDQTWNPYVAGRPEAFYLTFVKNDLLKGSYGPSLAINSLSNEQSIFLKTRLEHFSFISCREKTGSLLLEKILNRHVETVIDPTLLIDKKEWELLFDKDEDKNPYILTYFLGDNILHRRITRELSKKMGIRIVAIPTTYLEIANKDITKVFASPQKFISLIKNAALVCTDSFHGAMFSIIFGKNFYSFCKMNNQDIKSENSRLYDALSDFGLSQRIISKVPDSIENINYQKVETILENKRKKSYNYLVRMLYEMVGKSDVICNKR